MDKVKPQYQTIFSANKSEYIPGIEKDSKNESQHNNKIRISPEKQSNEISKDPYGIPKNSRESCRHSKRSISLHEGKTKNNDNFNYGLANFYLKKIEKSKKQKDNLMEYHFKQNIEDYKFQYDKNQLILQKLYDPSIFYQEYLNILFFLIFQEIDIMALRLMKNKSPIDINERLKYDKNLNFSYNLQNLYNYNIMNNKVIVKKNSEEQTRKYGDAIGTMHNNRFPGKLDFYQFQNSFSPSPYKIFNANK
jgi:hypothetical protein